MEWLSDPQAYIALLTLTALEIVLGIDNIIFISILVGRLPQEVRKKAMMIGLSLAMITRILLLLSLAWIMGLTDTLFTVLGYEISGRDIILIVGGLFLLAKSTLEIHNSLEGVEEKSGSAKEATFWSILLQIAIIDIVFSLDSVITAVGMVPYVEIMVIAIIISMGIMMLAAQPISQFIDKHPTLKMLALSFLVLIGVALIAEGLDIHVPKGYIYFAMGFSIVVEMLNIRIRGRAKESIKLHKPMLEAKQRE